MQLWGYLILYPAAGRSHQITPTPRSRNYLMSCRMKILFWHDLKGDTHDTKLGGEMSRKFSFCQSSKWSRSLSAEKNQDSKSWLLHKFEHRPPVLTGNIRLVLLQHFLFICFFSFRFVFDWNVPNANLVPISASFRFVLVFFRISK